MKYFSVQNSISPPPYAVSAPRRQNQRWRWTKESVESLETRWSVLSWFHRTGSLEGMLPVSLTSRHVRWPLRCIMRRFTSGLSDLGSQSRVLLANGFVVLQDLLQVAHSLFTILCFNLWREGNFKSLLYQVRPISLCQIKSQTMPYVVQ